METGVLKCIREFDNRLSDIMNCLLSRYLDLLVFSGISFWGAVEYHDLDLFRLTRKVDGQLEDSLRQRQHSIDLCSVQ